MQLRSVTTMTLIPCMETSDRRSAEENAGEQCLTAEFRLAILKAVEASEEPWLVIEPLFNFMAIPKTFEELEKFLASVIRNARVKKYFKKLIPGIAAKIEQADRSEELFGFLCEFAPAKYIKALREEPRIIEIVRDLVEKDGYISIRWSSYRMYLDDTEARAMEKIEKEIGEPINYGIVNAMGYEVEDKKVVEFCYAQKKLKDIPAGLGRLSHLATLRLNNNQLKSVPEGLNKLTKLKSLDLRINEISNINSEMNIPNLQTLELSYNKLKTLPESIEKLSKLQTLRLSENQITSLPESIEKLSNLKTLELDKNQLSSLPKSIGKLAMLETLSLNCNKLTTLPETLWNLSEIKRLYINKNNLTALPESIGNLKKLETLFIDDNKLVSFPKSIVDLPVLEDLSIDNNAFTNKNLSSFIKSDSKNYALVRILYELASRLGERKKYNKVVEILQKIVGIKPDFVYAWNFLGKLLCYEYDRIAEGEKAFKMALKYKACDRHALYNLGYLYNFQGDYEKAIGNLKKAVRHDPSMSDAWISLSFAYSKQKKYIKAKNATEKALKLNSKDKYALIDHGYFYIHLKKYKEAEKYLLRGRKY